MVYIMFYIILVLSINNINKVQQWQNLRGEIVESQDIRSWDLLSIFRGLTVNLKELLTSYNNIIKMNCSEISNSCQNTMVIIGMGLTRADWNIFGTGETVRNSYISIHTL